MADDNRLQAVVDIGSNNIRLVVYGGLEGTLGRAPVVVYSDKSVCQLGKNIETTGTLNVKGVKKSLKILRRFISVTQTMQVDDLRIVATAAVREATDGKDYVQDIKSICGVDVDILAGPSEARMAGQGVWYGIPDADGLVADLGGGSLELAEIKNGTIARVCSLPIGVLRYGDNPDLATIASQVADRLKTDSFLDGGVYNNLYLVGGPWRALMQQHMVDTSYGVKIIHYYTEPRPHIERLLTSIIQGHRPLSDLKVVSKRRRPYMGVASVILQSLLDVAHPKDLVVSGYGVREGILVDDFNDTVKATSALLASCQKIARGAEGLSLSGTHLFHWLAPVLGHLSEREKTLVHGACYLVNAVRFDDPDHRGRQILSWMMQRPLLGVSHYERKLMGYMMNARYKKVSKKSTLGKLLRKTLSQQDTEMAKVIGSAMALAYSLSGGVDDILSHFRLEIDNNTLILRGDKQHAHMVRGSVVRSLKRMRKFLPNIEHVDVVLKE